MVRISWSVLALATALVAFGPTLSLSASVGASESELTTRDRSTRNFFLKNAWDIVGRADDNGDMAARAADRGSGMD